MSPTEGWPNSPEKPKPKSGGGVSSVPDDLPSLPPGDNPVFIRQGAYLPHWQREGSVYAATFRLAGSLPQSVLANLKSRQEEMELGPAKETGFPAAEFSNPLTFQIENQIEEFLNLGLGNCWLKDDRIALVVADALRFFDGVRYRLYSWCLMPNHVHVLFEPLPPHSVSGILHSWKSFTAKSANRILKRQEPFWQAEYYDRLIRNWEEFRRTALYILENPAKARLKDWKWVWLREGVLDL